MLKNNEEITLTGKEAIEILKSLDYFVISLNQMARFYSEFDSEIDDRDCKFKREVGHFIIKNKIPNILLKSREILLGKFDNELGDDDMGDIERAIENTQYWEKPGD